jgi:hypothetical protein
LPNSIKILNVNSNNHLTNLSNLPNLIEKIILSNEINIHPIPNKLILIYCPEKVMIFNKIKKYKYKKSKKNFKKLI